MKKENKLKVLLRMLLLIKPLAGFMVLAVTLGTLGFLTAQFIPILGGYAILLGLGMQTSLTIQKVVGLLLGCALLRAVCRYGEQRTNHYIAFTLLAIIRDKVFLALRKLCPAKLEGRDKGDLISLITSDVELLEVFYAHTISPICIAVVTEGIMCLYIGGFHPMLGWFALFAFAMVGVALPVIISKRSGTLGDELRGQAGDLSAHMLESIRGIDEIQQYHGGEKRLDEIRTKTKDLSENQGKLNHLTGTNMAIANSLILVSDFIMLLLCFYLYHANQIGFDGCLLSLIALMSSFGPVTALSALGTTLQSTVASGARVLSILDEEPETKDIYGKESIAFSGADAKKVTFGYRDEIILKDVNLDLSENEIVGIVGPSGCGKSTLLKLFMRFWETGAGSIQVSQKDVKEINTTNLRDMEGYMTQDTQLFKDTILNNIKIAKLDATKEEVMEACKKASIHDFIMTLPKDYDTEVGELGSTLSGGERQRIGLARAFLHDAPFLLLDEPTSNLDSLNEAVVLKALKNSAKEKAVLLVSHRTSTMCVADRTFSMDGGRLS